MELEDLGRRPPGAALPDEVRWPWGPLMTSALAVCGVHPAQTLTEIHSCRNDALQIAIRTLIYAPAEISPTGIQRGWPKSAS